MFLFAEQHITTYMDGAPASYQLWNNYLIKNQNYKEFLKPKNKDFFKSVETIISLKKEVMSTMKAIQPQLAKEKDCVIMVIHVLSNPDWINIPCVQKIPAFVVCQKIMQEREENIKFTQNHFFPNIVKMCGNAQLYIGNRCFFYKI